jgi:tRNA threonylcarbamoyladenosine biosynthesis protein TsaB
MAISVRLKRAVRWPEGYNAGAMSLHILSLETSGSRCGVALLRERDGQVDILLREHDGVAEHSARLLPMVDSVLAEAGASRDAIDAVAFGQGPGGFTGLRVACGVAQGMGYALDIPVLPIVSNAAVEHQLPADAAALRVIALDARMEEAYLAVYRRDGAPIEVQSPVLIAAADVAPWIDSRISGWLGRDTSLSALRDDELVVAGDVFQQGAETQNALSRFAWQQVLRPDARAVAWLGLAAWQAGQACSPEQARPLYVRDKVAFTTREREQGAGGNPRAGA